MSKRRVVGGMDSCKNSHVKLHCHMRILLLQEVSIASSPYVSESMSLHVLGKAPDMIYKPQGLHIYIQTCRGYIYFASFSYLCKLVVVRLNFPPSQREQVVIAGPRRVYKEPSIQASPSRPYADAFNEEKRTEDPPKQERERDSPAVKSEHEGYAHHDAVTCTKSTVKFNKETNTAVVTLVATVRGDASVHDEHMNQRSVILAARALAHVCSALEEKASTAISAVEKRPTENATLNVNHCN